MKDQNKSKLAQYTAMAGAVLGTGAAQAQIIYVNINDTTVDTNGGYYDIDLDSDGAADFRITQYLDTGATGMLDGILITPFDSLYSRVAGELENGFNYPFKLLPGDSIQLDTEWAGNTQTSPGYLVFQFDGTPYPNSYWKGPVSNGYLGLRIMQDDGFHFGWARLDVAADNRSFTVKDFAYEETLELSILAGAPHLSVIERMLEQLVIGQREGVLFLSKPSEYDAVSVRVYGVSGTEITSVEWEAQQAEIDLSSAPAGVYLVEFTYNGIRNTRKVVHAQ